MYATPSDFFSFSATAFRFQSTYLIFFPTKTENNNKNNTTTYVATSSIHLTVCLFVFAIELNGYFFPLPISREYVRTTNVFTQYFSIFFG